MSKPLLFGLTGKARSGKDTTGIIIQLLLAHTQLVSWADPIRRALRAMYPGLNDAHIYGDLKETPLPVLGKSPRQMMQTLGTDWGRNIIHKDIWLMIGMNNIAAAMDEGHNVVVTDVRFENEAEAIRNMGGHILHIRRDNQQTIQESTHASEAGIAVLESDWVVHNTGTVEDLQTRLSGIIGRIQRDS
jgi:hypothetical protein